MLETGQMYSDQAITELATENHCNVGLDGTLSTDWLSLNNLTEFLRY